MMDRITRLTGRFTTGKLLCYALFLGLSVGLISRALLFPGCLPFDANDDRNHTLVNFTSVQHSAAHGDLPLYNFFNNFGTPIAGDALTLPFALHSLPFYLTAPEQFPYVLGFNRFFALLATLVVLFQFFRSYASAAGALPATLFAAATPGFVWHAAHHAYQFAILGVALLLLLVGRYGHHRFLQGRGYLLVSVPIWTGFVLATSPNIVAMGVPTVLYAALVLPGDQTARRFLLTLIAAALGSTLGLVEIYPFAIAMSEAARAEISYFATLPFTARDYWPAALWGAGLHRHHTDLSVYVGMPLLLLALIGSYLDFRKGDLRIPLLVISAGFAPFLVVSTLLLNPDLLAKIPLLRTIDITRIYWLSNIFLALGVARLADRIDEFYALTPLAAAAAVLTWAGAALGSYAIVGSAVAVATLLPMAALAPTAALTMLPNGVARTPAAHVLLCCIPLALLLGLIGRFNGWADWQDCRVSHFYSTRSDIFPPSFRLLDRIPPQARMAAIAPSAEGLDLVGVGRMILGSGGRSIVAHAAFYQSLLDRRLVERDDLLVGYHFGVPPSAGDLRLYGIRYLLSRHRHEDDGQLLPLEGIADGWRLYEVGGNPSPFHLQGRPRERLFLHHYRIRGRSIELELEGVDSPSMLTAAFTPRRGIRASVDGRDRLIIVCPDQLIRVPVRPGDGKVQIAYWPYMSPTALDSAFDRRGERDEACQS